MARIKPQMLLLQSKRKKGPTRISVTTILLCSLVVVLIVLSLVTTYRFRSLRSMDLAENGLPDHESVDGFADAGKFGRHNYAILDTSKGSIIVELLKDASPEIVDKFVDFCHKGHFLGMLFDRVIRNYVIQAGDLQSLGKADDWTSGVKSQSQLIISPKREAFVLGTSKAIHDKKGFELFITRTQIPDFNDKLVVFGKVIEGEDVVQEIEEVDTDKQYRPKSPIRIIMVTLTQDH